MNEEGGPPLSGYPMPPAAALGSAARKGKGLAFVPTGALQARNQAVQRYISRERGYEQCYERLEVDDLTSSHWSQGDIFAALCA